MAANVYNIEFIHFKIKDYESKRKLFEVGANIPQQAGISFDLSSPLDENAYRKIRYEFSEDVLRLPTIMTSLQFTVGAQEVHNFRMIERHYFRDELVKSFDFTFGFCIPGSCNGWDAVYALPPLEEALIAEMVACPYATKSDSFYFVDDEMIMHNKAEYKYTPEDRAQAKRSYFTKEDCKSMDEKAQSKEGVAFDDGNGDAKESKEHSGAKDLFKDEKWSKEDDYST